MPSKQSILDDVQQYSAQQLAQYIQEGIVTFRELCDETYGEFSNTARKAVQEILRKTVEDAWQKAVDTNTIEAYKNFMRTYPDSPHVAEAQVRLQNINNPQTPPPPPAFEDPWEAVDKNSIDALSAYLSQYPDSEHAREARKLITRLFGPVDSDMVRALVNRITAINTDRTVTDKDTLIYDTVTDYIDRKRISTTEFLSIIRDDNNMLRASIIQKLIEEGYITYTDLYALGIDQRFIQHLAAGSSRVPFSEPRRIESINKVSTEIYFWGIPSSGKSCALGAILSVANNGRIARSMKQDNDCQGYGYMTRLSQLFHSDGTVCTLPEGTSIYSTYEMGFDLVDSEGKVHPITCIDLAGELGRCMYKSDAGEDMSDDEVEALDTLTRILIDNRSRNRKIHFFVLEYGGEKRLYEGLDQRAYLDGALRYIERTGIFKSDTDAIYLMFTKVDKAGVLGSELRDVLTKYTEDNYLGFYQGLEQICKDFEINGGTVNRIPFTLGQVCFQDFCLFEGDAAGNIVNQILKRTPGFSTGKISKLLKGFKK